MNTTRQTRMLVTGSAGMVGSYVAEAFNDYDLVLTDNVDGFSRLDVRDPLAVMREVTNAKPDIVLHLAAATDVDRCEQDPDLAFHTNALGTQNIVLACQRTGATLVYISTAGVFDGEKPEPYTEFDLPNPANVYGDAKLAGERIVELLLDRYYIVRTGWMIGGGEQDKKFVGKLARLLVDGVRPLRAVNDKVGTPTYAKDLLDGIRRLIDTGYYGLYHLANQGVGSRYDVALEVRDALGFSDVSIEAVSSDCFPLPAPRARSEAMRNYKLDLLGMNSMRPWREALRDYVVSELAPVLSVRR